MDPITQIITDAYENVKDFTTSFRRDFHPTKNDNTRFRKHDWKPEKRGQALLDKHERQDLIQALAEGAKEEEMAELYGLTVRQVKKMKNNYRDDYKRYKKLFEKEMIEVEKQSTCDPIMLALRALKGRALMHPNGAVFLDGKPSCVKEMMASANMALKKDGKDPIPYPGVHDLPDHGAPGFNV